MINLPVVPICRTSPALCCRANQNDALARPAPEKRGGSRSSRTLGAGCDGRTSPGAIVARRAAFVRTAKPCGPGASTLALSSWIRSTDDGGKRARSPRRARRKPLKPSRRECRLIAVYLWLLTPVRFLLHRRPRVQRASGIPCALFVSRGWFLQQLGRIRAARTRCRVSPLKIVSQIHVASLRPSSRTSEARSGTHNHRAKFFEQAEAPTMCYHETLWLWVPACAGTTAEVGAISAKTSPLTPRPWLSCRTSASAPGSRRWCRR
jgi:hypothetical protein